jgi:hypothetical protein
MIFYLYLDIYREIETMNREDIKAMIREAFGFAEAGPKPSSLPPQAIKKEEEEKPSNNGKGFSELNKDEKNKVKTLTKKIKNATQGPNKLLKLSQVMDAAGLGDADDATDRSLYAKKVSGKPDADGKVRHLTPDEANAMGKVVDNPIAFK